MAGCVAGQGRPQGQVLFSYPGCGPAVLPLHQGVSGSLRPHFHGPCGHRETKWVEEAVLFGYIVGGWAQGSGIASVMCNCHTLTSPCQPLLKVHPGGQGLLQAAAPDAL